jgi:hypothetical protein
MASEMDALLAETGDEGTSEQDEEVATSEVRCSHLLGRLVP